MFEQAIFTSEHYKALIAMLHSYENRESYYDNIAKYYIAEMLRRDSSDFDTAKFLYEVTKNYQRPIR